MIIDKETTTTILTSPRYSNDSRIISEAARKHKGWGTHRAVRYQAPEDLEDPVVYGEPIFCDIMAQKFDLHLLQTPPFWLAELPRKYLRRHVMGIPAKMLGGIPERRFIKPADDKVFPAAVYEDGSHVPRRYVDPDCPCLVSEVVHFDTEVRCYILDRNIVTAGTYLTDDHISDTSAQLAHEGAQKWLRYLLADESIPMPSALVIDVGFINGGFIDDQGWAVIEANPAYCSGVYMRGEGISCDPAKLLPLLERASNRYTMSEDVKYIRRF